MSNRGTVGIKDRGRVLELPSGNDVASGEAAVAPAGRLRFRLNMVTKQAEISVDGSAYAPFASEQGGVTDALANSVSIPNAPGVIALTAPEVQGPAPKVILFTSSLNTQNDRIIVTLERNGVEILESHPIQQPITSYTFSAHWTDVAPPDGAVVYRVRMTSLDGTTSAFNERRITVRDL